MLFDATAVLVASLTVATVGGPVVLPENSGVSPISTSSSAHAGYAFTTPDANAVTSPAPHAPMTPAPAGTVQSCPHHWETESMPRTL